MTLFLYVQKYLLLEDAKKKSDYLLYDCDLLTDGYQHYPNCSGVKEKIFLSRCYIKPNIIFVCDQIMVEISRVLLNSKHFCVNPVCLLWNCSCGRDWRPSKVFTPVTRRKRRGRQTERKRGWECKQQSARSENKGDKVS